MSGLSSSAVTVSSPPATYHHAITFRDGPTNQDLLLYAATVSSVEPYGTTSVDKIARLSDQITKTFKKQGAQLIESYSANVVSTLPPLEIDASKFKTLLDSNGSVPLDSFYVCKPDWLKLVLRLALATLGLYVLHRNKATLEKGAAVLLAGSALSLPSTLLALGVGAAFHGTVLTIRSFALSPMKSVGIAVGSLATSYLAIQNHERINFGLLEMLYKRVYG